MLMMFHDVIDGKKCIITVDAGKKSKIVKVEGIESVPEPIQLIYVRECSNNYMYYKEYSEHERSKFFRGKCISGDFRENLKDSYEEWGRSFKNGTADPNWCDGVGLNYIRDRIIMLKSMIQEVCLETEYPECFYKELPPLVDSTYLADKEELIHTGYLYADNLEKEPFFKEIKTVAERTQKLYEKMCSSDKWGPLRNLHWMANLPEIYRNICDNSDEVLNLAKLKVFRKDYNALLMELKETLKKAIEEEKEKAVPCEKLEEIIDEWEQMSIFDFLTA